MARTTRSEDLATIGFSLWTILGLFVDAYKHVTDPQLETFWTPWHAIFYSGFVATAGWLVYLRMRHAPDREVDLFWAPQGYRPAMYGLVLFAAGGAGDAVWHEVFGVETSFDALLSPTHLILFVGLVLIVAAPLRARWNDQADPAPGYRSFFPALVSLAFTVTLVSFFFEYAWAPSQTWPVTIPYNPATNSEEWAVLGFLTIMVSTLILFAPLLVVTRRWKLPFGSVTTYMLIINVLVTVGFDKEAVGLPAVLLAALVMDVLIGNAVPRPLLLVLPPLALWSGYFALVDLDADLGWPPELWGGSIVFAVLAVIAVDRLLEMSATAAALRSDHTSIGVG